MAAGAAAGWRRNTLRVAGDAILAIPAIINKNMCVTTAIRYLINK